jgi:uncharacterized membrane protein
MLAPRRYWLTSLLVVASALAAYAQGVVEREVKAAAGRDVRFGIYADVRPDCTSGPLPALKLVAAPAHGTVTVKRGTLKATNLKQCLATELPVFVGFYRSAAGFNGNDEFELEISYPAGRKEIQHIRVNVADNAASGQPI